MTEEDAMKPFKPNGLVMKMMRVVLELNRAKEEIERLKRENLELVNEVRVLKLKDMVRPQVRKTYTVKMFNEGVVR